MYIETLRGHQKLLDSWKRVARISLYALRIEKILSHLNTISIDCPTTRQLMNYLVTNKVNLSPLC